MIVHVKDRNTGKVEAVKHKEAARRIKAGEAIRVPAPMPEKPKKKVKSDG